jgi:hypothetical protein
MLQVTPVHTLQQSFIHGRSRHESIEAAQRVVVRCFKASHAQGVPLMQIVQLSILILYVIIMHACMFELILSCMHG